VNKQVARKKGQIQRHPRTVAPFALRTVERQIMLDLSLSQMLGHALFVTGCGVDGKPFWLEYLIWRKLRQKAIFRSKSPLSNAAHSRIILVLVLLSLSVRRRGKPVSKKLKMF
jgi:hypothetical protein